MQLIEKPDEMRGFVAPLRKSGIRIALVATMGSLHRGKQSLINAARESAGAVIVSIYANPALFGPTEILEHVTHDREDDLAICEQLGVEVVFAPATTEFLSPDFSTYVTEEDLSSLGMKGHECLLGATGLAGFQRASTSPGKNSHVGKARGRCDLRAIPGGHSPT